MTNLAGRLDRALRAAGHSIIGVSIGDPADKTTWVPFFGVGTPQAQKDAARAFVSAFDPDDPALDLAELDAQIKAVLDNERLISAVVWTIIDTLAPPATVTKYNAARTKIIAAYKSRPWIA